MKLALIPGLLLCVLGHAADWPQWRGPNRSGVSAEHLPSPLKGLILSNVWSSEIGTGFSSLAISQGRLFTLGNQNEKDTVWCLDSENGKELWRYTYEASAGPQYYEGGPAATPTVDNARVFTISKWGNIFCFETRKGKVLWQRDLRKEGLKPNRWGFAGSPLVWKNSVIFNAGDYGIALNCNSGETVWQSGTNSAGYASPVLFRDQGKDRVLIFAAKSLVAVDPEDGREVWRIPFETGWDTNNSDPLVYEDAILLSSFTRGCVLLKVKADNPTIIYDLKSLYSHLSPGILLGQFLYAFSGEAKQQTDLRCINFLTGELKWSVKDPSFGSLLCVDGKTLVLSDKGELLLGDSSSSGFKVLLREQVLSGVCWTPPAYANGRIYARNAKGHLVCVALKSTGG